MSDLIINNDLLFKKVIELLREGRDVTIPIKGCSMLPLIKEGRDSVTLRLFCEERPPRPGDIVLFSYHGNFILHRILKIRDGIAEIQGDGNVRGKESADFDHIFGRVVEISRPGLSLDPGSRLHLLEFRIWLILRPIRRYLLFIYRHLNGFKIK